MTQLVIALVLALWTASAGAATRYVDGSLASTCSGTTYSIASRNCSGSDGAGYKTVEEGIRALVASDVLYVRAGTYVVSSTYGNVATDTYGPGASSWETATKISNYPGETVTIQNAGFNMDQSISTGGVNYLWWKGDSASRFIFEQTGAGDNMGFRCRKAVHHIRFESLTVRNFLADGMGCGSDAIGTRPSNIEIVDVTNQNNGDNVALEHGVYHSGCVDCLIRNSRFIGNQAYGMQIYNDLGSAWITNFTAYGNYIEGRKSGATGTAYCGVFVGTGVVVYNNICNGLGGQSVKYNGGFQLYAATGPKIYNNTVYDVVSIGVQINTGVTSADVTNNILNTTLTVPIDDQGTSSTLRTNHCQSADTGCSVTGSASFTSAATGDFTLQSGSTARDAGTDLSATLTTDYTGTARPQNSVFDLGAYEYIVSAGGGSGGMTQTPAWDTPRRFHLWRR